MLASQQSPEDQIIEPTRTEENKEPQGNKDVQQGGQQKESSSNNYQEEFPTLMDEKFFIEHPENFENKFYSRGQRFDRSKCKEIFHVMSKKNRHAKKQKQSKSKSNPKSFRK